MKKSKNKVILILAIILIMLVIIGLVADARYQTMLSGTGSASIANWSFKLVDADPQTTDVIELAVTRTDGSDKVVEGKMAPGTYGEFEIGIDARGTETVLEYTIDISLENAPRNLMFYTDETRTQVLEIANGTVTKTGYMTLEEVNEIRTEKIYWEWPYETGETDSDIITNDEEDTQDAGKDVTMQITVTGTQVLEEPVYLADVVAVGDYVNYDASSNGVRTFTSSDVLAGTSITDTISTDEKFSESLSQWRVLSVDKEKGIVELIAADPTEQKVKLSKIEGFLNAESVLHNIGSIYGHGNGATKGRSLSIEDLEKYSSFDPYTYKVDASSTGYNGGTKTYTNSDEYYKEINDKNGNVIGYETTATVPSSSNPVTMTNTYYSYPLSNYFSNPIIFNMFVQSSHTTTLNNKPVYWLASRCVELKGARCDYGVFYVESRKLDYHYLYLTTGGAYSETARVVPVVTLQTNIQTTGQDENGVWQLEV